jgi:hypothetical protein
MFDVIIDKFMEIYNSVNGMVWIGGGLFFGAIAYCVWLWRERF